MVGENIQAKLDSLNVQKAALEGALNSLGGNIRFQMRAESLQQLAQVNAAIAATEKELEDCLFSADLWGRPNANWRVR